MVPRLRRSVRSLSLLVALVASGALGAYLLRPAPPRPALPAVPPDDDLEMLAGLLEASAPREPSRDRLIAGTGEVYLARANDHAIVAVPKAGGAPRVLARVEGPVWGMSLANGALWLTTTRPSDAGGSGAVLRLELSGGAPTVVADGLARPRAIASDGRWVFLVDVDASEPGLLRKSAVVRLPADGGAKVARSVLGRCEGEVTDLVLDEANVYWPNRFDGTIVTAPKAGGDPHSLAVERGLPEQLVLEGDSLFWVEKQSESLWAMPKAGGPPRRIAQDFAGFSDLVVDRRGAWWKSEALVAGAFRVLTVPRTGGDPSAASEGVDEIDALASDGARLYWARTGEVQPVRAP
jgi:hypothetical protein